MEKAKYIWMDDKFIDWDKAQTHILSHTLHYGNGVFEGIRAYKTEKGYAIFRLDEHINRLFASAKITLLNIPFTPEVIKQGVIGLIKQNDFSNDMIYIRPIVYVGYGTMGLSHQQAPIQVAIAAWPWGTYLGKEGVENGVRVKISSFTKNSTRSSFIKAKTVANYLNSQMAKNEAQSCGYDEALLLDDEGFVAEGTGECIFIIKNKTLISPPNDHSLNSITQLTVIELAKELQMPIIRQRFTRDDLYTADEAFFAGTAVEITPIKEVDNRTIGTGGKGIITNKLQTIYFDLVHGKNTKLDKYLTYVK